MSRRDATRHDLHLHFEALKFEGLGAQLIHALCRGHTPVSALHTRRDAHTGASSTFRQH